MKRTFLLLLALICFQSAAMAEENEFLALKMEQESGLMMGCETTFNNGTEARTTFKVLLPVEPAQLWPVLIDTNAWKFVHPSDYNDSRSLDAAQYKRAEEQKPQSVKAFNELIGMQTFPSEHGRVKGGVWTSHALQVFAFPFPLKDRWAVIKIKNNESGASKGVYRYEYKMGAGNFRSLKGFWEIRPIADKPGWSEFRGIYDADPGIAVPHFLAKSLFKASVKRNAKENLAKLSIKVN